MPANEHEFKQRKLQGSYFDYANQPGSIVKSADKYTIYHKAKLVYLKKNQAFVKYEDKEAFVPLDDLVAIQDVGFSVYDDIIPFSVDVSQNEYAFQLKLKFQDQQQASQFIKQAKIELKNSNYKRYQELKLQTQVSSRKKGIVLIQLVECDLNDTLTQVYVKFTYNGQVVYQSTEQTGPTPFWNDIINLGEVIPKSPDIKVEVINLNDQLTATCFIKFKEIMKIEKCGQDI